MLFNSLDFAVFLPLVFFLYWKIANGNLRWQNIIVVLSSLIFYGWWDWRFLSLLLFSMVLDYTLGILIDKQEEQKKRKQLLAISLLINLGFLASFKYFNFFLDNFQAAFSFFGMKIPSTSLHIILPVGISFYTFQTLSYTIDIYYKKLKPTKDFIAFAAFVSFFPQLVAGPIERATNLLPQFYAARKFNYANAVNGMRQILWGFFKKLVIADNCAYFVNHIFAHSDQMPASVLALGAFFFAFQIYGDFSGYSDIAIGTARLFNIQLMRNFAYPYFSRDIAEFWRRWHISLSTWFRDYLYFPLGGSRGNTSQVIRNTFIIFLVSGFWHGANWTFIVWGLLHAIFFMPLLLTSQNRKNIEIVAAHQSLPNLKEVVQIGITFALVCLAWIFFRAENLTHALHYIQGLFSRTWLTVPDLPQGKKVVSTLLMIIILLLMEWQGRKQQYALEVFGLKWKKWQRWLFYAFFIFIIIMFMQTSETPFIYFQF